MSHPTWVRGLKFNGSSQIGRKAMSHPTWVRGLKLTISSEPSRGKERRTPRGCVD